jgi:diaminopimelate epimerase
MNGLGNDFVVLDGRARRINVTPDDARRIGDRRRGVGCDQIIVLEPSKGADVFMRIFNSDGSEVGACGNAARCVARVLAEEEGRPNVTIETHAGVLRAEAGDPDRVVIDMGPPRFAWDEIPLSEPFHDTTCIELQIGPIDAPILHSPSVVNVGNPHAIFWVEDVDAYDLGRFCAAAVAAARKKLTQRQVAVELPGGTLLIDWSADDRILMTGPAALEFEGTLAPDMLSPAPV